MSLGYIMFENECMDIEDISLRNGYVVMHATCTAQHNHRDLRGIYYANIYGLDGILVARCPTTINMTEWVTAGDLWQLIIDLQSSSR